jgi:hypothetical protein
MFGQLHRWTNQGPAAATAVVTHGSHAIQTNDVLNTSGVRIRPDAPGDVFRLVNTDPDPDGTTAPKFYNEGQALAMKAIADQRVAAATQAKAAYRQKNRIAVADLTVKKAHARHVQIVAATGLRQVQTNAKMGAQLQGARVEYLAAGHGYQTAETHATTNVNAFLQAAHGLAG